MKKVSCVDFNICTIIAWLLFCSICTPEKPLVSRQLVKQGLIDCIHSLIMWCQNCPLQEVVCWLLLVHSRVDGCNKGSKILHTKLSWKCNSAIWLSIATMASCQEPAHPLLLARCNTHVLLQL